jgi:hypothetical protein
MTETEQDFLGDLAGDDHFLWEAFAFVRLHSPQLTDTQILASGRELLAGWSSRGWLTVTDSASASLSTETLLQAIDRLGVSALYPERGSDIELSLTPQARQEVPWL